MEVEMKMVYDHISIEYHFTLCCHGIDVEGWI
jgi:hypothetical protein